MKILLFSRDPGGANTVIPLVQPLKARGYDVTLWGKDVSLNKYQAAGLQGLDIMDFIEQVDIGAVREFLSSQSPDLVITATSADDFCEKYMWKAAEELGIVSFAILDQWVNYGIRFSQYPYNQVQEFLNKKEYAYLPSRIFLMDELARQEALKEGLPASRLVITGQPHLQAMMEKKRIGKESIVKVRNSLDVAQDDVLIIFASEPITENFGAQIPPFGYTEKTILEDLLDGLQEIAKEMKQKAVLVIRPHPRERRGKFEEFVKFSRKGLKVIVSSEHQSEALIESADCVCGMSSMFLLESLLLGSPIISIETGLQGESIFVLDRNNIIKSIRNKEQLAGKLKDVLVDKEFRQPALSFAADAISRVVRQVDGYFDQKKAMRWVN